MCVCVVCVCVCVCACVCACARVRVRVCVCRVKAVKTGEDLADVYAYFQLYYGRDMVAMQHRKTMQRREGDEEERNQVR